MATPDAGTSTTSTKATTDSGEAMVNTTESSPPEESHVPTFSEVWFDDPIEGEAAQRAAMELKHRIELRAKPIRHYLEETIVPLLLQGLQHLVLERPSNPIEYLAAFLLRNNPYPSSEEIDVDLCVPFTDEVSIQTKAT